MGHSGVGDEYIWIDRLNLRIVFTCHFHIMLKADTGSVTSQMKGCSSADGIKRVGSEPRMFRYYYREQQAILDAIEWMKGVLSSIVERGDES